MRICSTNKTVHHLLSSYLISFVSKAKISIWNCRLHSLRHIFVWASRWSCIVFSSELVRTLDSRLRRKLDFFYISFRRLCKDWQVSIFGKAMRNAFQLFKLLPYGYVLCARPLVTMAGATAKKIMNIQSATHCGIPKTNQTSQIKVTRALEVQFGLGPFIDTKTIFELC